jgi:hypothetical protein
MRVMGVVDFQILRQACVKIMSRSIIATLEEPPRQDAKPQLDLIQPGAMLGRKMKDMFMRRLTQEGTSLDAPFQRFGHKRHITPRRDEATHVQAPMGIDGLPI